MAENKRFGRERTEAQIGREDASRAFQIARNAERRNSSAHYAESPIWHFETPLSNKRARK